MKTRRIAIDLYDIRNIYIGVGEFSYRLGLELSKRATELRERYGVEFYFFVPPRFKGCFGEQAKYVTVSPLGRHTQFSSLKRFDLFHSSHQFGRIRVPLGAGKVIQTVHDLNFMYEKAQSKRQKYFKMLGRRINGADALTFISDYVSCDVHKHYALNMPTHVIHNGVANLTETAAANPSRYVDRDYLFHISGISPKKNVHLLVEMMRFLPEERLLIAGNWNSPYARALKSRIAELGLTNIKTASNVDTETKAVMYQNCKAFLFPSLCEGFGLPPIEAMNFGKPVFLSTLSSLPEVGGSVAFYWPLLEPEAMAEQVQESLRQLPTPEALRQWASQFTWERCIDGYISLYLKMLNVEK